MKKIITTIALSALFVSPALQVSATGDISLTSETSSLKMEMKKHEGKMEGGMMKEKKELMKKISDSLDDEGKAKLKEMRERHMDDMEKFKKDFPGMKMSSEKKAAKEEMKTRHFADLKELLKDNPELYKEVAEKMEMMMAKMMKKMMGKGGEMKKHEGKMEGGMMKEKKELMKKISDSLDDEGKAKLKEMRERHMDDMEKFKKDFPGMEMNSEKKAAKEEMKTRHFADLKELLKDNPELYKEVSEKMEMMMAKMMKKMMGKGGEMKKHEGKMKGKMMKKEDKMNENEGMMKKNEKSDSVKKGLVPVKTKIRINKLINRLFNKLDKLDGDVKMIKVNTILNKIEDVKLKYSNISDESKKENIYDMLDYLKETIGEKFGL